MGQTGVEETDQNADECDENKKSHNFQRAEALLGHKPPAEDNEDRCKKSGEYAVKLFLKDHVSFACFIVKSKACSYRNPCSGNCTDNDTAKGCDCFTDSSTDIAYKELDGLSTHVIALEVQETHSEICEQVPYYDVENSTHG